MLASQVLFFSRRRYRTFEHSTSIDWVLPLMEGITRLGGDLLCTLCYSGPGTPKNRYVSPCQPRHRTAVLDAVWKCLNDLQGTGGLRFTSSRFKRNSDVREVRRLGMGILTGSKIRVRAYTPV